MVASAKFELNQANESKAAARKVERCAFPRVRYLKVAYRRKMRKNSKFDFHASGTWDGCKRAWRFQI